MKEEWCENKEQTLRALMIIVNPELSVKLRKEFPKIEQDYKPIKKIDDEKRKAWRLEFNLFMKNKKAILSNMTTQRRLEFSLLLKLEEKNLSKSQEKETCVTRHVSLNEGDLPNTLVRSRLDRCIG